MKFSTIFCVLFLAGISETNGFQGRTVGGLEVVVSAKEALARAASDVSPWPSFEPSAIPCLVFDGTTTWLIFSAETPEDFGRHPQDPTIAFYPGRHPSVVRDSITYVADMLCGSVIAGPADSPPALAARIAHEQFHVYWRRNGPKSRPFLYEIVDYPIESEANLLARRLETEALRRAMSHLALEEASEALAWMRTALKYRYSRSDLIGDCISYEELAEGLATYVEFACFPNDSSRSLPVGGYAVNAVIQRCYDVGRAWAVALDAFAPGWKHAAESDLVFLPELLSAYISDNEPPAASFSQDELVSTQRQVKADLDRYLAERTWKLEHFEEQDGYRVEFYFGGSTMQVVSCNMANILRIAPGEFLHDSGIYLTSYDSEFSVLVKRPAVTGSSSSTVWQGSVERLVISGLEDWPLIKPCEEGVRVECTGTTALLPHAMIRVNGKAVLIRAVQHE